MGSPPPPVPPPPVLPPPSPPPPVPPLPSQDQRWNLQDHLHHNPSLQDHPHRTYANVINIHFRSPLAPVVVPQRFPSSCLTLTIILIPIPDIIRFLKRDARQS